MPAAKLEPPRTRTLSDVIGLCTKMAASLDPVDSDPEPSESQAVPKLVPRVDEVTRPVDVPVAREHGLSGRLLLGTELRLEARVGRGASGEVYKANCAHGGPPLAVKVLHPRSADSVRLRFHREVEILRQLDSPWVVKVKSEGLLPDGRPWYAMEFIDGQSLAKILASKRRSSPARVVAWLRGACRGLAAIHDSGWVHRDVKPANLIVVSRGDEDEVKIVDLGIAERIHAQPDLLSGTPEYIAPEQAEFRPVDVRSDVYALGCCAYELLTGRRLVEGRSAVAKINAHIEGVRPCWPRYAGIPAPLRRLVERCLARQPEARPPNMHELEADLERVQQTLTHRSGRFPMLARPRLHRTITELELACEGGVVQPRRRRPWANLARTLKAALTLRVPTPAPPTAPGLFTLRARAG